MSGGTVRAATEADLPAITRIYNHYIENSPATFDLVAFDWHDRRDWFAQFDISGRHRIMVATNDRGDVAGYAYSAQFRGRAAYDGSIESSVYLDSEAVGGGTGSALYTALFDSLSDAGIHRVFAGIAMPNDASVALHSKFGFTKVGVFSEAGFKFGRYHDVLWMEKIF